RIHLTSPRAARSATSSPTRGATTETTARALSSRRSLRAATSPPPTRRQRRPSRFRKAGKWFMAAHSLPCVVPAHGVHPRGALAIGDAAASCSAQLPRVLTGGPARTVPVGARVAERILSRDDISHFRAPFVKRFTLR